MRADFESAPIEERTRALLRYAVKLTREPSAVVEADVVSLRRHGYSDRDIHRATQVAAYFNYINRVADGLGVDLEPDMPQAPDRAHG